MASQGDNESWKYKPNEQQGAECQGYNELRQITLKNILIALFFHSGGPLVKFALIF